MPELVVDEEEEEEEARPSSAEEVEDSHRNDFEYRPPEELEAEVQDVEDYNEESDGDGGDSSADEEDDDEPEPEFGKCCFCDEECNPASQACGRCARERSFPVRKRPRFDLE